MEKRVDGHTSHSPNSGDIETERAARFETIPRVIGEQLFDWRL